MIFICSPFVIQTTVHTHQGLIKIATQAQSKTVIIGPLIEAQISGREHVIGVLASIRFSPKKRVRHCGSRVANGTSITQRS